MKRTIVFSFGGGVQSVALFYMMKEGLVPWPDLIVFADTGWEPPSTLRQVNDCRAVSPVPFVVAQGRNLRDDLLDMNVFTRIPMHTVNRFTGKKGMLRRICTNMYKVEPINAAIRQFLGVPRLTRKIQITLLLGISIDEAQRMKPNQHKSFINRYPLIDLGYSRKKCEDFLRERSITNIKKSSCVGCPYHSSQYWHEIRRQSPELFEDSIKIEEAINKKRVTPFNMFLSSKAAPLGEVMTNPTTQDLFGEECSGYCHG